MNTLKDSFVKEKTDNNLSEKNPSFLDNNISYFEVHYKADHSQSSSPIDVTIDSRIYNECKLQTKATPDRSNNVTLSNEYTLDYFKAFGTNISQDTNSFINSHYEITKNKRKKSGKNKLIKGLNIDQNRKRIESQLKHNLQNSFIKPNSSNQIKSEGLINHKNTFESKGSKDKTIFSLKSENNSDEVKSILFKEIIMNDETSSSNDKNDNSKNIINTQIDEAMNKSNNNSFKGKKSLILISSLINEGVEADEDNERIYNKIEMDKSRSNIISMSSNQYVDYSLEFDNDDIKVKKTIKTKSKMKKVNNKNEEKDIFEKEDLSLSDLSRENNDLVEDQLFVNKINCLNPKRNNIQKINDINKHLGSLGNLQLSDFSTENNKPSVNANLNSMNNTHSHLQQNFNSNNISNMNNLGNMNMILNSSNYNSQYNSNSNTEKIPYYIPNKSKNFSVQLEKKYNNGGTPDNNINKNYNLYNSNNKLQDKNYHTINHQEIQNGPFDSNLGNIIPTFLNFNNNNFNKNDSSNITFEEKSRMSNQSSNFNNPNVIFNRNLNNNTNHKSNLSNSTHYSSNQIHNQTFNCNLNNTKNNLNHQTIEKNQIQSTKNKFSKDIWNKVNYEAVDNDISWQYKSKIPTEESFQSLNSYNAYPYNQIGNITSPTNFNGNMMFNSNNFNNYSREDLKTFSASFTGGNTGFNGNFYSNNLGVNIPNLGGNNMNNFKGINNSNNFNISKLSFPKGLLKQTFITSSTNMNINNSKVTPKINEKMSFDIKLEDYANGKEKRTTLMLRNVPNKYTIENCLNELDEMGFKNKYAFFYLPPDLEVRKYFI